MTEGRVAISGLLLTGGSSRRLGRDKATLVLDGATLAARAAAALGAVCDDVVEVGDGHAGGRAVREEPPGGGPLAALVAGVDALGGRRSVLLLACDLPNVDAAFLAELRDYAASGTIVPAADGRLQYACARYSADAIVTARELLAAGERSLHALVAAVPHTTWTIDDPARFADVDTPADLKRWGIRADR